MTKKYAATVSRMTETEKVTAAYEVEIFARENEWFYDGIERGATGQYCGTVYKFENDDIVNGKIGYCGVDVVRCPHCNEIQACWGQYGDPAHEITICRQCNEEYKVEPF